MAELQLSNFVTIIQHYRLSSNDERVMFDWLVFKCSFNLDGYTHSIPQIQKETNVTRFSQEKIIKKFCDIGFLKVEKVLIHNCAYKSFRIDFNELSKTDVLEKIIEPSTTTYNAFVEAFRELAEEQKLSPKARAEKQRTNREEVVDVNTLYNAINKIYGKRIEMYNNGELSNGTIPKRKKAKTNLPKSNAVLAGLRKVQNMYNELSLKNAFTALADASLTGEVSIRSIMSYFLKYEDGDYPVIAYYLDTFNSQYSHD